MSFCCCEKCGRQLKSQKAFDYHVIHNVCGNKHNHKCPQCGSMFSSKQMLNYHTTHHVCEKISQKKPKLTLKTQQNMDYSALSKGELIQELARKDGEIHALTEHPQTVNNNNNQINIIVPPAFLTMDNYSQIVKQLPNLLHNALSLHPANFISYLIKETNCNPNRPIYNSIKITNKKDNFAQISDGQKYIYASKKKIIEQLIENKRHILQEYVDNNGDKYGEKILRRYQNYVDFLDDDKEAQKELEVDIICMLLNVSDIIGSDEWSKKLLDNLKTCE